MRYDQLEHAIRAACEVSGDTELQCEITQEVTGWETENLLLNVKVPRSRGNMDPVAPKQWMNLLPREC